MKKKYIVLLIALLLFSALFRLFPFLTRVTDSAYIRPTYSPRHFIWDSNSSYFYCEPSEAGYEISMFSENGEMQPCLARFGEMDSTLHLTAEPQKGINVSYSPQQDIFAVFPYPQYTDYVGCIVKEEGRIVSASLYKIYTISDNWTVAFEELGSWEYPFLNEWISETYVENELRKLTALDRIFTFDSALNRMFLPEANG